MPRPSHGLLLPLTAALLLALAGMPGCERGGSPERHAAPAARTEAQPAGADAGDSDAFQRSAEAQQRAADAGRPVVLFLGDSLTAGYGLPKEQSFPAVIRRRLQAQGYPHRVVNAGVSGDTSAGGLARLDWLLQQRVDVMVLALGANDGLRARDPAAMEDNLARIIERAQAEGITVVLAGMHMPSNYGEDYTRRYRAVFPRLAEKYGLPFIPFLLRGVGLRPEYNQPDGIHPNAEGARLVADNVWAVLDDVLDK